MKSLGVQFGLILLLLLACNGRQEEPTPTVADAGQVLGEARTALEAAAPYRWTTTFSIQTGDEPEVALTATGERSATPAASRVEIREPGSTSAQAGWVRIGEDLWILQESNWVALPASAAGSIDRLAFLDPAGLWSTLDDEGASQSEVVGEETVGDYETRHYRFTRSDAGFLPTEQFTPTVPVRQDIWIETETSIPVRTALHLEGTNPNGVSGQINLEITLSEIGEEVAIAPPADAAGAAIGRVSEALPDGTSLPLAPGAEEALPEDLPEGVDQLVANFSLIGDQPSLALQIYSTPEGLTELTTFFEETLTAEGYSAGPLSTDVYGVGDRVLLFSSETHNVQVILVPLDEGTLVITTLQ